MPNARPSSRAQGVVRALARSALAVAIRERLLLRVTALGALVVVSCGGGAYGWLSREEQSPFRECVCSHPACSSEQTAMAADYASRPLSERDEWLTGQGCERDERGHWHHSRGGAAAETESTAGNPDDRRDLEVAHSDFRVETRVDEFTGEVSYVLEAHVAEGVSVTVLAARGASGPWAIFDVHSVSRDGWRYLDCHRLNMLVDGVPLAIPEAEHSGSVGRSYVIEHVSVPLTAEALDALAHAQVVRFRICNSAFAMPSGFGTALRDLRSRTTGETLTDAAAPPAADLRARETAARDHGCALDTVTVGSEHDTGFWLNVCGTQRFYRREADHFVEQPVPPPQPVPTPE